MYFCLCCDAHLRGHPLLPAPCRSAMLHKYSATGPNRPRRRRLVLQLHDHMADIQY
ncbi:hypothetical protein XHC_2185 [Xanthomonas hortorum pv. carotae str. M081]|nr:hypothetical protein XHC_2185 [Xanthomonas hortorum pv. carotae str. M081]